MEWYALYSKLTFLGYTFILGREVSAHTVWKMVTRPWDGALVAGFLKACLGQACATVFPSCTGDSWMVHTWPNTQEAVAVSLPCSSMVFLPNDAARCWPIPGAEGGCGTASFSWSWEKPFGSCIRRPLCAEGGVRLCPSSCDTRTSLFRGLTSRYTSPCKRALLCHGKQTGIVWGLRKSMRERHPLPHQSCRAIWTVVCANNWDLWRVPAVPGAEISQSCLWWAWDDRRRPKGGARAHVGSKAPGCKQAFCALSLTYKVCVTAEGRSAEQLLVLLKSSRWATQSERWCSTCYACPSPGTRQVLHGLLKGAAPWGYFLAMK